MEIGKDLRDLRENMRDINLDAIIKILEEDDEMRWMIQIVTLNKV